MRIGFIGLGAMGLPMARNLAGAAGIDVTFYDVRADVLEQVADLGAAAGSIGELVAGVDAVFTVLPAARRSRAPRGPGRRTSTSARSTPTPSPRSRSGWARSGWRPSASR
jgi:hypothetical protein